MASFYPLVYLAETVGSGLVEVIDLTPGGADPHHLELAPVDIATMDAADMLLYLDGFQPAVDDAVGEITGPVSLDVAGPAQVQDTSDSVRGAAGSEDDHDH
ncbi:MAG TPA: zinc ABC transporter substrate-binding protein, partial [Beutenbergiaceae bacterium]|nr:zinc ABC transporter substrate-binding protein [Beutenbergiaceae bacterium]